MRPQSLSIPLAEYVAKTASTDKLPPDDLRTVLLGLFGEVGSIMAAAKKYRREKGAFVNYGDAVEEEFGDTLWYLGALCRRCNIDLDNVFSESSSTDEYKNFVAANDFLDGPISHVATPILTPELDPSLIGMGKSAADLFDLMNDRDDSFKKIAKFSGDYLRSLVALRISFARIVHQNIIKTVGRFDPPDFKSLPTFDDKFGEEERLPEKFEITIDQRSSGRSYLRWNNVFIGDPLTDNILDADGYRFHDVFHFANAAILHWSPTFRSLIKQKRKSDPLVDEAQDGGRAIVVEEGLTAWIFARAKELKYFEGQDSLSFDLLKTIQQFVAGYEVEVCPLSLWEMAILKGYEVFRLVRSNQGGVVIGDRLARTIDFRPLNGG